MLGAMLQLFLFELVLNLIACSWSKDKIKNAGYLKFGSANFFFSQMGSGCPKIDIFILAILGT